MATDKSQQSAGKAPAWMKYVLIAAAIYNALWGAFVIFFPERLFRWADMAVPIYPEIWQCVGMIVGVYGLGYAIAAFDPIRHWPIVLVGLLGKVLGPIGMADAVFHGRLPVAAVWLSVTNDLIWWVPFGLILWASWKVKRSAAGGGTESLSAG